MAKKYLYPKRRKAQSKIRGGPRDYENWGRRAPTLISIVDAACASAQPRVELNWTKGTNDRLRPLTSEDLAAGLFVIEVAREYGSAISYATLSDAFGQMFDFKRSCHRNKASRLLAILADLGLIRHSGNYRPNKHGNKYVLTDKTLDDDLSSWLGSRI